MCITNFSYSYVNSSWWTENQIPYSASFHSEYVNEVGKLNIDVAHIHIIRFKTMVPDFKQAQCFKTVELCVHYSDAIVGAMASQITSLIIAYSTVYSGADQRKHQSSAPLAFVWGIHRWPVNSPHKWPVTRKMFPFDDVIMCWSHGNEIHWIM